MFLLYRFEYQSISLWRKANFTNAAELLTCLIHQRLPVPFYGAPAGKQFIDYLLVSVPLGNKFQYLGFPFWKTHAVGSIGNKLWESAYAVEQAERKVGLYVFMKMNKWECEDKFIGADTFEQVAHRARFKGRF